MNIFWLSLLLLSNRNRKIRRQSIAVWHFPILKLRHRSSEDLSAPSSTWRPFSARSILRVPANDVSQQVRVRSTTNEQSEAATRDNKRDQ